MGDITVFDKIKDFIKGTIGVIGVIGGIGGMNLFKKTDIKKELGVDIAVSQTMLDKINVWDKMYCGKADWCEKGIFSLRLEQSIVREFANISLNEMTVNITNDRLKALFDDSIEDINEHLQKGLALGAMIIKPLGDSRVQYVPQNAFIPVEYDVRGRLKKVIFPEIKKMSDNSYYTRLEYHDLTEKGLTITNTVFHSTTSGVLGNQCDLSAIAEWANLEQSITYPLMTRTAFGYYRNPISNTIDNSFCGVSIFDCAAELIKKTDIQFGRLDWEFESGERRIHLDDTAVKLAKGSGTKLDSKLYVGLNSTTKQGESLFQEFSPVMREQSYISGLEEYKRNIEFAVGLSYGDISSPQTVEKTATEIKSAKKRKYNTVSAIQNNLKECLEDTVYAIAFYNSLATIDYDFICDFKDSILTDEETERKQDKEDLSLGILSPAEYRSKWYGESLEEAQKNLPQQSDVIE